MNENPKYGVYMNENKIFVCMTPEAAFKMAARVENNETGFAYRPTLDEVVFDTDGGKMTTAQYQITMYRAEKEEHTIPVILLTVRGGVCEVIGSTKPVKVVIIDWDEQQEDNSPSRYVTAYGDLEQCEHVSELIGKDSNASEEENEVNCYLRDHNL